MPSPFNQIPVNAEWMHKTDALAKRAASELESVVLLVAMQADKKIMVCVEGEAPKGSELEKGLEFFKDNPAGMLAFLSMIVKADHDHEQRHAPRS